MFKRLLKKMQDSDVIGNVKKYAVTAISFCKKQIETRFGKEGVYHATNFSILFFAYLLSSLIVYPSFRFTIFFKEVFALVCTYCAIFFWFINYKPQASIKVIIGTSACIAPVFFMNTSFVVSLVMFFMLLTCEFIIFEYVRGCDLFSNKMPIYAICEKQNDLYQVEETLDKYKVLEIIFLTSVVDSIKVSSINSLEALDKRLQKIRRITFFQMPCRLLYFSKNPVQDHLQKISDLSLKYSIPAFEIKIQGKKNAQGLAPLNYENMPADPLTFLKGKRIWIYYDGRSCMLELIKMITMTPVDLTVVCVSECIATILNHQLKACCDKVCKIKIMQLDNFLSQDNKPDILFYDMPIHSTYSEENNQKEAVIGNVIRTQQIIKFAQENKIEHVFIISSIKAFNANSWIGATLRLGELLAQTASRRSGTKFHTIRLPDDAFSQTEIYGEILTTIQYKGALNIRDRSIDVLQNKNELVSTFIKAIAMSLKNAEFSSSVLTVSLKEQVPLDNIIEHACRKMFLKINDDVPVEYNNEPQLMDLNSFPNISETLEKTGTAHIYITQGISNEKFKCDWSIGKINKMTTRELVSEIMQALNEGVKLSKMK